MVRLQSWSFGEYGVSLHCLCPGVVATDRVLSMGQTELFGGPRGVMVKALDYEIVVREFELQSRYYVLISLGKV